MAFVDKEFQHGAILDTFFSMTYTKPHALYYNGSNHFLFPGSITGQSFKLITFVVAHILVDFYCNISLNETKNAPKVNM